MQALDIYYIVGGTALVTYGGVACIIHRWMCRARWGSCIGNLATLLLATSAVGVLISPIPFATCDGTSTPVRAAATGSITFALTLIVLTGVNRLWVPLICPVLLVLANSDQPALDAIIVGLVSRECKSLCHKYLWLVMLGCALIYTAYAIVVRLATDSYQGGA